MNRNKYGAKKTVIDGIKFDSMAEGRRYKQLVLLQKAGVIEGLELQPRYDLIINGKKCGFYKADFRYNEAGNQVVEDVKGMKTPVYNLKKKLIKAIYNIDILETK
jgi:hypothetical protein